MKAFLITIGDEILSGITVNTNAANISRKLESINIQVKGGAVIGDDESQIKETFGSAWDTADITIVTGGLGPTHDDLTRKCIIDFFECGLIMNENVLTDIQELFNRRGRKVTKLNEDQAFVPEIAEIIRNKKGTAPGSWISKDDKIFISLPGVPYEMETMMDDFVIPKLEELNSGEGEIKLTKSLMTTGIPESYLYERLGNISEILNGAQLAFLPNQFGVKMQIKVFHTEKEEAINKLSEIEQKIRSLVGRYIYGQDDISLEEVVAKLLTDRGLKIAVAESCTGGLISNRLTNISGSSGYFERGFITYSNAAKVEELKVDEDMLHKFGSVSLQIARQMAEGVKAVSLADIGLAVTGIMGPTGASENKPVGLVYIGICDDKVCTAKEFRFGDDRLLNKDRTAQTAIDMVRKHLLGIGDE